MGKLTDKVKNTLMGAKDTVVGTDDQDHKKESTSDPLTEYESKEPPRFFESLFRIQPGLLGSTTWTLMHACGLIFLS